MHLVLHSLAQVRKAISPPAIYPKQPPLGAQIHRIHRPSHSPSSMESIPISPLSSHASPPSDEEVREVLSSNITVVTKQNPDKPASAQRASNQASETSCSVVTETAGLHSKSPPREPSGYLLFRQTRDAHRAKSCLSPPSSGGLQPPSYKPSATAIHDVEYIQPGLPPPRPKAQPKSLTRQTLEKRAVEAFVQTPQKP